MLAGITFRMLRLLVFANQEVFAKATVMFIYCHSEMVLNDSLHPWPIPIITPFRPVISCLSHEAPGHFQSGSGTGSSQVQYLCPSAGQQTGICTQARLQPASDGNQPWLDVAYYINYINVGVSQWSDEIWVFFCGQLTGSFTYAKAMIQHWSRQAF